VHHRWGVENRTVGGRAKYGTLWFRDGAISLCMVLWLGEWSRLGAWRVVSFGSFGGVVVLTFGGAFVDEYVGASYC
jgi:hypothetical protein